MTSASLMHEAGHPKPVLWDDPEGWGGERGGSVVQDVGTRHTVLVLTYLFSFELIFVYGV